MELRNAQSVTIAYDGTNPDAPMVFGTSSPIYTSEQILTFRQLCGQSSNERIETILQIFHQPINTHYPRYSISEVMVNGPRPHLH